MGCRSEPHGRPPLGQDLCPNGTGSKTSDATSDIHVQAHLGSISNRIGITSDRYRIRSVSDRIGIRSDWDRIGIGADLDRIGSGGSSLARRGKVYRHVGLTFLYDFFRRMFAFFRALGPCLQGFLLYKGVGKRVFFPHTVVLAFLSFYKAGPSPMNVSPI